MYTKADMPVKLLDGKDVQAMMRFFFEFSHLKQLYRQGWIKRGMPEQRCESVADHTFGVGMLGYVIAETYFPELDSSKILKLAMVHDVGEAYAGDFTPHDKISPEEKSGLERKAVEELFLKLPNGENFVELWQEYELRSSPEAAFLHEIDKLEMLLQASVYEHQGFKNLDEFFPYAEKKVSLPHLKEVVADALRLRG